MSYEIERSERPGDGLRRVAEEQVGAALESLSAAGDDAGEAVHDARKRMKKIRAVLRLARKHVGEEVFDRENVAYRDAARVLAPARDADVAVETVDRLTGEAFGEVLDDDAFGCLRGRLVERRDAALAAAVVSGGPVDEARERIREAAVRVDGWPVDDLDLGGMRGGLRKVYERGSRRMDEAREAGTGEAYHEWRKRVKYLWYHLRLLGRAWPAVLEPVADVQHDLSDLLGEGNDLTDLLHRLEREPEVVEADDVRMALEALADRRRRQLWERALPLGVRLYAEDPDAFVLRLDSYWRGMRLEEAKVEERGAPT